MASALRAWALRMGKKNLFLFLFLFANLQRAWLAILMAFISGRLLLRRLGTIDFRDVTETKDRRHQHGKAKVAIIKSGIKREWPTKRAGAA